MSSSDVVKALMAFTWNNFLCRNMKNICFHICQERKEQKIPVDQSGAIRAGVGLGEGRQGRDRQDPGFHPCRERWTAVNTFHTLD